MITAVTNDEFLGFAVYGKMDSEAVVSGSPSNVGRDIDILPSIRFLPQFHELAISLRLRTFTHGEIESRPVFILSVAERCTSIKKHGMQIFCQRPKKFPSDGYVVEIGFSCAFSGVLQKLQLA